MRRLTLAGRASGALGRATALILAIAVASLAMSAAHATPDIGKGKPCQTCHKGSPPTKSNVKR